MKGCRGEHKILALAALALVLFASIYVLEYELFPNVETMEKVTPKSINAQHQTNVTTLQTSTRSAALQMAVGADPSWNLANYTWETTNSERWIPPHNVPHLSRRDMLQIFSKENTLWIGDSTARQDYHTLNSLLWQPEPFVRDYYDLGSLDFVDVNPPKHMELLEQRKNQHLGGYKDSLVWCRARAGIPQEYRGYILNLGLLAEQRYQEQCQSTNATTTMGLPSTGKHDYALAKTQCWSTTIAEMKKHKGLLEGYSVLVISNGVYYAIPSTPCTKRPNDLSLKNQTYQILDYLRDQVASPLRTVIWKLYGPGSDTVRSLDYELADAARSWFRDNGPVVGMDLADFHFAVRERTEGDSRIAGDSARHWGLQARLLSLDLIARTIARTSLHEYDKNY